MERKYSNGRGSAINTILLNISGESRSSVKRLRNQGKKGHEMGSPSKSNGRKQVILDNFEAQLLRRIVLSFYYGAKRKLPPWIKSKHNFLWPMVFRRCQERPTENI